MHRNNFTRVAGLTWSIPAVQSKSSFSYQWVTRQVFQLDNKPRVPQIPTITRHPSAVNKGGTPEEKEDLVHNDIMRLDPMMPKDETEVAVFKRLNVIISSSPLPAASFIARIKNDSRMRLLPRHRTLNVAKLSTGALNMNVHTATGLRRATEAHPNSTTVKNEKKTETGFFDRNVAAMSRNMPDPMSRMAPNP